MISCGSEQEKLTVYIPDTCTDTLQYEIYLPEEEGLNIFYDLCVTDSFCAFLDTRNDTLLKIFTATIPPALVGLGMKGEGPDDFLFPFSIFLFLSFYFCLLSGAKSQLARLV